MGGNVLMSCPWVPAQAFTILSGKRIEPKQRVEPVSVVAALSEQSAWLFLGLVQWRLTLSREQKRSGEAVHTCRRLPVEVKKQYSMYPGISTMEDRAISQPMPCPHAG